LGKSQRKTQESVNRAFIVTEIALKGILIRDDDDVRRIFYDACLEK
jgi:hypothetical protein